jgi:AcrR family transcriptional regulator
VSYDESAVLRHQPKQQRGQRKVEHILRSAEALFAEVGFENTTTNAIAARAGVSIGSLYQFFSSKDAILGAMANRYLSQTQSVLNKSLLELPSEVDFSELVTNLLETLVKLQEQRPYFLQALGQSRLSPSVNESVGALYDELTDRVLELFQRGMTEPDARLLRLRARICVETFSGILPLALRTRGRERTRVLAEVRDMLVRYLEPSLKNPGML